MQFSYAVKLGGCFHLVKDSEVDGLFTLIQFRTGLTRLEAQAQLHSGQAVKAEGLTVTAVRKQFMPVRQPAVLGYISERIQ